MLVKNLRINSRNSDIEVIIERKSIKKVRLKVFPNGVVKLSAPLEVSDKWLDGFLTSKREWLTKTLNYFQETAAHEVEKRIHSGAATRILGRQIRIIVTGGKTYKIEQKGNYLYIQSPAAEDEAAVHRQFERWWHKQSQAYFLTAIARLYPIVAKHGVSKPSLQVRKMKTLWGSCSRRRGKVNLNYYLYKAPPACIDYVVLHELAHFLYPYHDKDFYEFLTVHMPDWPERKKILDHEIVKGLAY